MSTENENENEEPENENEEPETEPGAFDDDALERIKKRKKKLQEALQAKAKKRGIKTKYLKRVA